MTTNKKRKRYAYSDSTLEQLEYLVALKQEKTKKKIYPCDVIEEVIKNAYEIAKVFKN